MFAEARDRSGEAKGKFSQLVVLPGLQGEGQCGKEAFLLKALLVLLVPQNGEALLSAPKKIETREKQQPSGK
ncbi:hypothetical protein [Mucilaginibacter pedocola]|uniref:Uncharacterized protein n=1 Tax=Mucilaginibacter pedocola TaxID=1792845 RepID=A0A1S9PKZ4_9SPHI|nr:hypothetical protein [Mucilaginibacter pedocola]OOQ61633.1 hypothetical protein BC343_00725 [Mucilaginibacter pedocola]